MLMTWLRVVVIVTGCALVGMCLGGAFGYGAGRIAPTFFRHLLPWQDVEPIGVATLFGATAGVLLGGGLGCFGVLAELIAAWRRRS
jgi:hypothetical protein